MLIPYVPISLRFLLPGIILALIECACKRRKEKIIGENNRRGADFLHAVWDVCDSYPGSYADIEHYSYRLHRILEKNPEKTYRDIDLIVQTRNKDLWRDLFRAQHKSA